MELRTGTKLIRYMVVICAGYAAGSLWGAVLVDFVPSWFSNMWLGLQWAVLMLPIMTSFLCALLTTWWSWREAFTYAFFVLCPSVAGNLRNEKSNVGNLSHIDPVFEFLGYLLLLSLLFLAWGAGSRLRTRLEKRGRREKGRKGRKGGRKGD